MEGEKGEGEGKTGRNSDRGSGGGEAAEQNLRPERPARTALLLFKTIFEMFKLCVHGSLIRTPASRGHGDRGRGEAAQGSARLQAGSGVSLRSAASAPA